MAFVPIKTWPSNPPAQTGLQAILPSYLYQQYADDTNLQGFVAAYNGLAQAYVQWFNTFCYPVYAGNPNVSGPALDWVAQSLYGMSRPTLASGAILLAGAVNTVFVNQIGFPVNQDNSTGSETVYVTSDDIFARILTWHLYKGDGSQFNVRWLKRRVMRFLYGADGTDYLIDQTFPISVSISGTVCTIKTTATPPLLAGVFSAAIAQGVLELPPFYSYLVVNV